MKAYTRKKRIAENIQTKKSLFVYFVFNYVNFDLALDGKIIKNMVIVA